MIMSRGVLAVVLLSTLQSCNAFGTCTRSAVLHSAVKPRLHAVRAQEGEAGAMEVAPATPAPADPRRVAVSGLTPTDGAQQQQYAGVPPPGSQQAPPSFLQKAKAPFMGFTLLASLGIAGWQSNRMYKRRQDTLLEEFAATMVFRLGDEREMKATLNSFRSQLGPGRYTTSMVRAFLKNLGTNVPIGAQSVRNLQSAMAMFKLTDAAAAKLLEEVAEELGRQPSVLGKLVFLAERAMPMPASMAKLRTKFPNWSFDTVTALQRAMLETHYRELIEAGKPPDGADLQTLGLSEEDAQRLQQEVQAANEAAERAAEEKAAEERKAAQLQRALELASQDKKMNTRTTAPRDEPSDEPGAPPADDYSPPAADDDDAPSMDDGPMETAGSGTHEYECKKCGYTIFPAAGREFKFFGDDFTCAQCGCGKEEFVDNGPIDD